MAVEEERKVYSVRAFNRGIAGYIGKLPTLWVEGEITELRRQQRWQSVFFTLKDPADGASLPAQMPRGQFDALQLDLVDGERVQVFGRAELYEQRGELRLKVMTIERAGLGAHLAALERLKKALAAEGLFDDSRKRALPRFPKLIGLVTGNDAAAKRDVLTGIQQRFPPANVLVAETYVQGPRAVASISTAIGDLCRRGVDVIVLARGGGSFEDLLPFSDERVVRAVATCAVPIVSAVGHEQDTPLCDLAADVRASTPTAAARLVVPDLAELRAALARTRERLHRGAYSTAERHAHRLDAARDRLRRAPALSVERRRARLTTVRAQLDALSPQATLGRGYAIVRKGDDVVRAAEQVTGGDELSVLVADGTFGARVE
ncbi:MAG TPA: exodeoxyribonuclease VII large subunit [Gaiellaceae bacterium]|nr:exodeoxyribonuclease VII large subunit [Gaiellaceae bacterium]